MRDLRLKNNDFHTYLANFRDLKAKLVSLGEKWAESTYHDLFILGLGDWQQEFIRTKLDEFYATKQGLIQNLNLDDLMDQLATRATTATTRSITVTTSRLSTANSNDERSCHYCENTGHLIKFCWFRDPSLVNGDWKERNKERIEALRHKNSRNRDRDKEDLLTNQLGESFYAGVSSDINELLRCQPSYPNNEQV
ncbi:hypothetical protein AJ78_02262 [Emergomyces pasteurianus Ep9510]|uniref:Uncharacterized protein n=1 Tax=Emergomyces pasteurianus Ep9510 TaxID=1447872 RepID=A0A1J9QNC0_9EURO|nr:hypothetical protein AJ78_02262 [Emergomyces pasteurianus Ep9510]